MKFRALPNLSQDGLSPSLPPGSSSHTPLLVAAGVVLAHDVRRPNYLL
jgi:hypothetical protein